MAVSFKVGNHYREVGSGDFLHSFFSTISFHLEPNGWGSRFPELMNELYQGQLASAKADKVLTDVLTIREELKAFPPERVVWDIEDISLAPPWGNNISDRITDLSNYYVTNDGKDLFDVLIASLEDLKSEGGDLTIR